MDSSIDVEKRGGRDNDTPVDMNGLVIKSGDQVDSSDLDPRLSLSSRRAADEPTSRQTEKEGYSIDDNDTVVDEPLYVRSRRRSVGTFLTLSFFCRLNSSKAINAIPSTFRPRVNGQ